MAISSSTFSDIGGAVSDLFAAEGQQYKEEALQFEEQNYTAAATLAGQNAQYTATSTAIKQGQQERQLYMGLGKTQAAVANAGLANSGNSLDILRESAQEGATANAALGQQGLITEAGYKEQQTAYENMASAANVAIEGEKKATLGDEIAGGLKLAGAVVGIFSGGGGGGDTGGGSGGGSSDTMDLTY